MQGGKCGEGEKEPCCKGLDLLSEGFSYGIKDTIDKGWRILAAETLGHFHRLINGSLGGNILLVNHLIYRNTQDIPVRHINSLQTPVAGMPGYCGIHLGTFLVDALEKGGCVWAGLFLHFIERAEIGKAEFEILLQSILKTLEIILEQELEDSLTGSAAYGHGSSRKEKGGSCTRAPECQLTFPTGGVVPGTPAMAAMIFVY